MNKTISTYAPGVCPTCKNARWVCERHSDVPWAGVTGDEQCCGGAGELCPDCPDSNGGPGS